MRVTAKRVRTSSKTLVVVCLATILALLVRMLFEYGGGDRLLPVRISAVRGTRTAYVIHVEGRANAALEGKRVHVAMQPMGADYYLISAPADVWGDRHNRWQVDCPLPRGQQSTLYAEFKAVAFLTRIQGLPSRVALQQWDQYDFSPKSPPKTVRTVEWHSIFVVMDSPSSHQLLAFASVLVMELALLAWLLTKWHFDAAGVVTTLLMVALAVMALIAPTENRGWVGAACVVVLGGADVALAWALLVRRRPATQLGRARP